MLTTFITTAIQAYITSFRTQLSHTSITITDQDDFPLSADLSLLPLSSTLLLLNRSIIHDFPLLHSASITTDLFRRYNLATTISTIQRDFSSTYRNLKPLGYPPTDLRYSNNHSIMSTLPFPIPRAAYDADPRPQSPISRSSRRRRSRSTSRRSRTDAFEHPHRHSRTPRSPPPSRPSHHRNRSPPRSTSKLSPSPLPRSSLTNDIPLTSTRNVNPSHAPSSCKPSRPSTKPP